MTQNKESILPVATERAWLMWPNKLFRGRAMETRYTSENELGC